MTEQFPVADITVEYVNPVKEGRKLASVKDADGKYWGVQPSMLGQFSPGMKCKVEYEEWKSGNGRTIKKVIGNGAVPSLPKANYMARKNPSEQKMIFIQGVLQAFIGAALVRRDRDDLAAAIADLKWAWETQLAGIPAQRADDLDDEIIF